MAHSHSYEDVHRLVLKMREGSTTARRELIEAHVGLAFKSAQEFEDDEALSDALVTLVQEVDKFKGHPAALPAYLKVALSRAAAAHRRPQAHNAQHDASRFLKSGRTLSSSNDFIEVDVLDDVLQSCETDMERKMVYYRAQGYTNAEVGLRIGCSPTTVADSMRRLSLRFQVKEKLRA